MRIFKEKEKILQLNQQTKLARFHTKKKMQYALQNDHVLIYLLKG